MEDRKPELSCPLTVSFVWPSRDKTARLNLGGAFSELGRGHIDMLLEYRVESRFRTEADLFGNGDDRVMLLCRISQQLLGLFHTIRVDEVEEVLTKSFVNNLRKVVDWY